MTRNRTETRKRESTLCFYFFYTRRKRDAKKKKKKKPTMSKYKRDLKLKSKFLRKSATTELLFKASGSERQIGTGGADSLFLAVVHRKLKVLMSTIHLVNKGVPVVVKSAIETTT